MPILAGLFIIFLSHSHRNIEPNPCNWPIVSLLKSTTSPHPAISAIFGSVDAIVPGSTPIRRAPAANNAPPCMQSRAWVPASVKVLSGFTSVLHDEINANEILLHKSI
jgi:hypothetical protein